MATTAAAASAAQLRVFANAAPQTAVRPATSDADAAARPAGDDVQSADDKHKALPEDMTAAVRELTDALRNTTIGLQFEIDETTHKVVTKVIDRDTGELIRQLPSEEVMRIARAMTKLQGLLVHQSA